MSVNVVRKLAFCIAVAAPTLIALLFGIATLGYWTIPKVSMVVNGTPIIAYDPEIGFVPFPNSVTRRSDGRYPFDIFTDARGARVTRAGDVSPPRPDILFVGDSFTWGHGVDNAFTFANRVPQILGVTGTNVAMGSYGTTQSVQMLRKNSDLSPKLVVYLFITDHLLRNILPCARAYYPFCLDISHVKVSAGSPSIVPPWSNGIRRTQIHTKSDAEGLDPITWFVHGLDVIYGRILWSIGKNIPDGQDVQNRALEFLLGEMAQSARAMNSKLLFAYVPIDAPPPPELARIAAKLNVPFLDLTDDYRAYQATPNAASLVLVGDGHPSPEGHAFIASKMAAFIAREKLLERAE